MKVTQDHCAKISKNGLTAKYNCGIAIGKPQDSYKDTDVLFAEKDGAMMTERLCWGTPFIIINEEEFFKAASETSEDIFVLFDDFSEMRGAFFKKEDAKRAQEKIFDKEKVVCEIKETKLNRI